MNETTQQSDVVQKLGLNKRTKRLMIGLAAALFLLATILNFSH